MTPALLLATALVIDGEAALRHAAALAALGPHTWGSPLTRAAAEYVSSQFRAAGLSDVRLAEFERERIRGASVIGVLKGDSPEFVVVAAHHDTAPGAPGAYDDGGGVGVLIEAARVLAGRPRSRSIVFISFDGEEGWSRGALTPGSREYVESLGKDARRLVAAVDVEMCGFKDGTPAIHPIAYADPRSPGRAVVAPAWLVRTALEADPGLRLGDAWIPWLYQAATRFYRASLYGDDIAFTRAGLPALMLSDSTFTTFYPAYHSPADTKDKLDAEALARMGRSVLALVTALLRVPPEQPAEATYFVAFGRTLGPRALLAAGALSLLPGLGAALRQGRLVLGLRATHAALFALLLWRHPVPALWCFLLPNLLAPFGRLALGLAHAPVLALAVVGVVGFQRAMFSGVWLAPWDALAFAFVLLLPWLRPPASRAAGKGRGRRRPAQNQ